jgi:polyisoprenoid-binding protein YceI
MRAVVSVLVASAWFGAGACGPGVQKATLSPAAAAPAVDGGDAWAHGARIVVEPPASRIVVAARDVARGSHPLHFDKFRGTLALDREGGGSLRLEIETPTLRGESAFAENLAQSMLEVARFPQVTLVARLEPGDAPDARKVTGNVNVHGVERGIAFRAKVKREGDAWRLHAVFDMSRSAFGIHADGAWDPLIRDDFRVTFDLRGAPASD